MTAREKQFHKLANFLCGVIVVIGGIYFAAQIVIAWPVIQMAVQQ